MVVPHTRTVRDLLQILDIVFVADESTAGDFWRNQPFVALPDPTDIRPSSFETLTDTKKLQGKRIGVPKMYVGSSEALNKPITTRRSIVELLYQAKRSLEQLGAPVVETDFPLMTKYDTVSAVNTKDSSQSASTRQLQNIPVGDGLTKE